MALTRSLQIEWRVIVAAPPHMENFDCYHQLGWCLWSQVQRERVQIIDDHKRKTNQGVGCGVAGGVRHRVAGAVVALRSVQRLRAHLPRADAAAAASDAGRPAVGPQLRRLARRRHPAPRPPHPRHLLPGHLLLLFRFFAPMVAFGVSSVGGSLFFARFISLPLELEGEVKEPKMDRLYFLLVVTLLFCTHRVSLRTSFKGASSPFGVSSVGGSLFFFPRFTNLPL